MEARLPEMFAFFFNPNLLALVESIIGPEITLSPIQHLRPYTPMRGERQPMQVPWHQDQGVTREEADASEILTVWFPLVDVDRTNGCLQVLPGVTRLGLLQHERTGGTHIKPSSMPQVEPCDCVMRRGDLLLMSAYTPHHGHQNRSDRGALEHRPAVPEDRHAHRPPGIPGGGGAEQERSRIGAGRLRRVVPPLDRLARGPAAEAPPGLRTRRLFHGGEVEPRTSCGCDLQEVAEA